MIGNFSINPDKTGTTTVFADRSLWQQHGKFMTERANLVQS